MRWQKTVWLVGLSVACVLSGPMCSFALQQKVEVVSEIENQEALLAKVGDRTEGVFKDGDRLTFVFHTDAAKAGLTSMIGASVAQQGYSGPYLGQVIVPESDKLIMSYAFTENDENGWDKLIRYRGINAPAIPISISPIQGQHLKYQIKSEHLNEVRRIDVYVPKVESDTALPVAYLTDGGSLGDIVGSLDWKIRNGQIAPVVVVGVHSGGYIGDRKKKHNSAYDHRAHEYLSGMGDERYEQHNQFLSQEVFPFVEKNHNVSSSASDRILSGYSNGGAYAVTLAVDHPDWFGDVFAYSVAFFDRDDLRENVKGKTLPRFKLAAGTLEGFLRGTRDSHEILTEAGAAAEIRTFVAGHDPLMWEIALLEDLENRLPGSAPGGSPKSK